VVHMRPWLVSMLVVQREMKRRGVDPSYGLDQHFLKEARQSHKEIGALEDAASQLRLFSSLSEDFQDRLLLNSLVDTEKWADSFEVLTRAWQSGDAAAIQEVITGSVRDFPQLKPLMIKLLDDRNTAMTAKIERFLQTPKTYFVAVGAGHLIGN